MYETRSAYRPRRLVSGLAAFVVFTVLFSVFVYFRYLKPRGDYYKAVDEIRATIESLQSRRPADVPDDQWRHAVSWTSNVIAQIYFSPSHGDLESLQRLSRLLKQKITVAVDLSTLRWIWDQCEQARGRGQIYAIRFRNIRLLTKGPITDDRISELWSLDKCTFLDLSNTEITDIALLHLCNQKQLRSLRLHNTAVTSEAVTKLQQALPDCNIYVDLTEDQSL